VKGDGVENTDVNFNMVIIDGTWIKVIDGSTISYVNRTSINRVDITTDVYRTPVFRRIIVKTNIGDDVVINSDTVENFKEVHDALIDLVGD